jgi:hypothetical protein
MQCTDAVVARPSFLVLRVAAALVVISTIAAGQLERRADAATLRQVVTGRVCMPDGSPAVGAVVVTSAGGQAATAADGSFRLEVECPLEAESLEVTASSDEGPGGLAASVRIVPVALSSSQPVGQLVLAQTLACNRDGCPSSESGLGRSVASSPSPSSTTTGRHSAWGACSRGQAAWR